MTILTTDLFDATHANIGHLPAGQHAAGYMTGSGGIPWTTADWAAHPGAVRIDQSPLITSADETADVFDLEGGAVTLAEIAQLVKDGQAAFKAVIRPGQRWPAVYCSRNSVHQVANALIAGGVTSCPLAIADFSQGRAESITEVSTASGPYPVIWRQYSDQGGGGTYDLGIVSVPWLAAVSMPVRITPQVPPGQWLDPSTWTWRTVSEVGTGLDGLTHQFDYNPATGAWVRVK